MSNGSALQNLKYDISQDIFFKEGIARAVRPIVLEVVKESAQSEGLNGLGNLSELNIIDATMQKIYLSGLSAKELSASDFDNQLNLMGLGGSGLGFLSKAKDKIKGAVKKVTRGVEKVVSKAVAPVAKLGKNLPVLGYINDKNKHKNDADKFKKLAAKESNPIKKAEYTRLYKYHAKRYAEKTKKIQKAAKVAAAIGGGVLAAGKIASIAKAGASKAAGLVSGSGASVAKGLTTAEKLKEAQDNKGQEKKQERLVNEYNEQMEELEEENQEDQPSNVQIASTLKTNEKKIETQQTVNKTIAFGLPLVAGGLLLLG